MFAIIQAMIKSRIVIVGGGFGGVKAALELAKNKDNRIVLISDREDLQYYPTLFSSATGHSRLQSWISLGAIFGDLDNINVVIDTIERLDSVNRVLIGKSGERYQYETCILSLGMVTSFFGIPGLDKYAMGIKSYEEIHRLKQSIYVDIAENHVLDKNYVIIGGGPTGVELAGSLRLYIKRLCRRYGLKRSHVSVSVVEAAPRLLPRMSESSSRKAKKRLEKLGVNVHLNSKVESVDADSAVINGEIMPTHSVIWTSGVTCNQFYKRHDATFQFSQNGRIKVNEHLLAANHIYVLGDNADTKYSGLAQTALHDGVYVARYLNGQAVEPYKPRAPFSVVPIGENYAILERGWLRFAGWPAAAIRSMADLVGYRDILSWREAIALWLLSTTSDDDYFTPHKP